MRTALALITTLLTVPACGDGDSAAGSDASDARPEADARADTGTDAGATPTTRERIRATPMVLGKSLSESVAFAEDPASWELAKSKGLNAIRLCVVDPWYRERGYDHFTVSELLPHLDTCIDNAEASGMHLILNYHDVGNVDFAWLDEFWSAVAPRYKDRSFVSYEIANEPTFDMDVFASAGFLGQLESVYRSVRTLAPAREVILFSFNHMSPRMKGIVDSCSSWVDWDKTIVGYHFYGDSNTAPVEELAAAYDVICTEWDYPGRWDYVPMIGDELYNAQTLERLGHSWADWRDWDDTTLDELDQLQTDARAKGYWWGGL